MCGSRWIWRSRRVSLQALAQTRGWDLRLTCIVGETEAIAPKLTLSGLVVPCGGCGAPLSGPIHDRSITCDHCNTSNLLPEAVFLRLVPDASAQPFRLVYDVDDTLLVKVLAHTDPADARWRHDARYQALHQRAHGVQVERSLDGDGPLDLQTAKELAARDLTAEDARRVDRRLSNRERERLVGGRVAQQLINLWAAASDAATRAIAVRVANPERFVADPDVDVRTALAVRKHLPEDVIDKLATDRDASVRAAIAGRKDCPLAILKQLAHDSDATVAKAARANPSFPPGLFKRLFGG